MNRAALRSNSTLVLVVLGALTAFGPFSIDTYLPALPEVADGLGASIATVQLSISSFFFGMALGQLFIGPISDRFGRKMPLYAGVGLYIVATVGCVFAPSASALMGLRFFQALGGAAGAVISRAMVRDLFPPHETARVFSLLTLVMGVAPILAPTLGGVLLAAFGWRSIFVFLTLFGVLALLGAWLVLPETRPADASISLGLNAVLRGYASIAAIPQFLRFALVGGMASAGMFAYIAGSSFVYIERFGVSPSGFAWIFGVNALGYVTASQINRYWLARQTPPHILRLVQPVQFVAGLCLLLAAWLGMGGLPLMLALNFIFVAAIGFIGPNTMALALAPFRRRAGAASALLGSLQSVVATLAAAAVSVLHNGTIVPMTLVMAACGLIALLLLQSTPRHASLLVEPQASD